MMPIGLAFYTGVGTLTDRMVRMVTRSRYSHVELIDWSTLGGQPETGTRAISASWRDGGVREKRIPFDPDHWQLMPLHPWHPSDAFARARACLGAPYDLPGILLSQILNTRRQAADRWFCSELCGYALGLAEPHTLAPSDLLWRASDMNRAFERGIQASG